MGSNVLLGHDGATPVYLRYDRRTAHVAILGKSRFGKTTLLEHLILQDMRDDTAAIVIDAHGDLTKRLISLAPSDIRDKLILVEANGDRPFGLNLYECPPAASVEVITTTVGNVVGIFHKLMGVEGGGLLPVIDSGLRNTARVLIANGLTMAEIPQLYLDPVFRHAALAQVSNPGVHQYWQEYESSTRQRQQERRDPVLNKVGRFLEDDLIHLMIGQARTTVPFKEAMDGGGTLILNLVGLDRESVSFLGMVFLSVLSNLIHQRSVSEGPRSRVHLYLDEYGRFATSTTQQLLEEGGKYGLGVTIAHQNLAQTPQREALHVESLIAFQLSGEDAPIVANEFDCTPTRTKKVARQRTDPQYKEWDEEIWDSETAKKQYDDLSRKLYPARERADLAERRLSILEKSLNEPFTVEAKSGHRTFVYDGSFPFDRIRKGLLPLPVDKPMSWHMPFNPSGAYFNYLVEFALEHDTCTRSGMIESNAIWEQYFYILGTSHWSWLSGLLSLNYRLSDDAPWVKSFKKELAEILGPRYERSSVRFIPDDSLGSAPPPGYERRVSEETPWPLYGHWVPDQFPEGVTWLAGKIAELYRDQTQYHELRERAELHYARHHSTRHHKEYLGEKPSQETVRGSKMVRSIFPGGTSYPLSYEHQVNAQWFDYVEELDQTHADRQAEIANMLTQLPRYVAYCKVFDPEERPHD
ncbi:helicase HerA domain-containing protein [Streptomyces sp. NBC_00576]|uniref:helicase HerA domain-containing protein n=1 Tax=Streptomyces sp. NBC_00576 TaxID=2903665 RepID=UPI002E81CFD9|nr:DUF87 domain-containing protein [Streptomyces sp. NBC_00576]WUB69568.1 type IV secretion system DNA-binding domain-containing protein [Streptomyces sp. NBC_00576]